MYVDTQLLVCEHSTPSVEKIILSPLDGLGALVKNQGTTNVRVYFRALKSILWVSMSIHCFRPQQTVALGIWRQRGSMDPR